MRMLLSAVLLASLSCTHTPKPPPSPFPNPTPPPPSAIQTDNGFLVNSNSLAARDAAAMGSHPDGRYIRYIANHNVGKWYLGTDVSAAKQQAARALASGTYAVMVFYNIPHRDCGNGGLTAAAYKSWVRGMAASIGTAKAMVILEPDALAHDCLNSSQQQERYALTIDAVNALKAAPNAKVYLDGGHSAWHSPEDTAQRLQAAGVAQAAGFSLNVSNYRSTEEALEYGRAIAGYVGKRFVIDTSRNGNGPTPDNQWCNARGRALGYTSRLNPTVGVDAYIWVKPPGESDGNCNGGPAAGQWWREVALEMARNAGI